MFDNGAAYSKEFAVPSITIAEQGDVLFWHLVLKEVIHQDIKDVELVVGLRSLFATLICCDDNFGSICIDCTISYLSNGSLRVFEAYKFKELKWSKRLLSNLRVTPICLTSLRLISKSLR